ncbi:hypothetical protein [Citrobacter portucalensis]|uniref:hypothetical protein n=1 Tax=Citrobacter portucalensis TaxID=1639133 RepID=UPI001BCC72D2|nr:hypothetical protein [Citrobacter portucalensis]
MERTMNYFAEATPDGVTIVTRSNAGVCGHTALLGFEEAITRLDAGEYDNNLDEGFAIHLAVAKGGNAGWFDYTAQHNATMWRWLIAAAFIAEMKRENGTTIVTDLDGTTSWAALYSNGDTTIPLYPLTERLAMANNIEGAMLERYGVEQGIENIIIFYRSMLDVELGELTPFGREVLAELHDHFISDLEVNGWPETPVAH